jgi:16S rRNA U1498 N3-methylase RsmE
MNLLLLEPDDFIDERHAVVRGRRAEHVGRVLRAREGDTLLAGRLGGPTGTATSTEALPLPFR